MIGLEREITSALREHAEGDVDVAALLASAQERGARLARRRRTLGGLAAGVTALALIAGFVLVVDRPLDRDPQPTAAGRATVGPSEAAGHASAGRPVDPDNVGPSADAARAGLLSIGAKPTGAKKSDGFATLPHPPVDRTAVPASQDASVVGDARFELHLNLSVLPRPVQLAQWTVLPGWERLIVQAGTAGQIDAEISPDRGKLPGITGPTHPATVAGVPATVAVWQADDVSTQVRWQPVPGIWAQLSIGAAEPMALAVAAGLRLTQVYRCAVPFRLAAGATKLREQGCGLVFTPGGDSAMATVGTSTWSVTVADGPGSVVSDVWLGGRPAQIDEKGGAYDEPIMQIDLGMDDHTAHFTASGQYDRTVIIQLAKGYREVAVFDRPDTWQAGPLG
jgi:hypothetical protein